MTLRARVTAVVVAALALLLLGTAVLWVQLGDVRREQVSLEDRLQPAGTTADDLLLAYAAAQESVGMFVIGGGSDSLRAFEESLARASVARDRLSALLAEEPDLGARTATIAGAQSTWLERSARPRIVARQSAGREAAILVSLQPGVVAAYDDLVARADEVRSRLDVAQREAQDAVADAYRWLVLALALSGILLLAGVIGAYVGVRRFVLAPLDRLRSQLRAVARRGDHGRPIAPSGPPELIAVGMDAEALRRQLVDEIDEAVAAREALSQQGPLVAAIRAQLHAPVSPRFPGVAVHGVLHPAEGVLAGDWWDVIAMPGGRVGLVVTDVAGHGADAGISALRVKTTIAAALASGLQPSVALTQAASVFAGEDARFATCLVMVVDPVASQLVWANAGHPPGVVAGVGDRPGPSGWQRLDRTGPLLSWIGGSWSDRVMTLVPDALVLVWTDGLDESHDASGVELSDVGVLALVAAARSAPRVPHSTGIGDTNRLDVGGADTSVVDACTEVVESVLAAARARAVDWRRDDVTLVACTLTLTPVPTS